MATTALVVANEPSGQLRLEYDYDDTSDPLDRDLILFRCVNGFDRPVRILIQRGNGQVWADVSIPAGETVTQNAGGPVQKESDIPRYEVRA